ncbi:cytochrome P450 4A12A [Xylariaceae sp. FL0804]|nr:cytochrome P450 4A12A [Xylariaceae sp. FL0804]
MDIAITIRKLALSSVAAGTAVYGVSGKWSDGTPHISDLRLWTCLAASFWLHMSVWAFYRVILWPKYLSPLRHLPEPTVSRSWWNGYVQRTFQGMNGAETAQWQREIKHDGVFRYLGVLNSERLVFTSVEGCLEVLQRADDFIQPRLLSDLAERILGPGLVLVNGHEHRRQRRLLLPSFSMRQIRSLFPVFWAKAVEIQARFDRMVAETATKDGFSAPMEIDEHAGHVALDVISKAALGVDFRSIAAPDNALVATYRRIFSPTRLWVAMALCKYFVPAALLEGLPIRQNAEVDRAKALLRGACSASVAEKKALFAKGELESQDIVSALIRDRAVADDEELVTHMMMMLGAGHETVSVGLTWCMYELCRRPEWQAAIRAEVRANLPSPGPSSSEKPEKKDSGGGTTPDAYSIEPDRMPLLHAFVSECLRYWPPIPMVLKSAVRDTTVAGVFVPANTKMVLSIYGFNRAVENWGPDAEDFRPERWLDGYGTPAAVSFNPVGGALSKYSLMSFIHGPRDCIGRVFARHEMLCVLSCWVGRFEFSLADSAQAEERNVDVSGGGFSSKPLHGIHAKARRVPGW